MQRVALSMACIHKGGPVGRMTPCEGCGARHTDKPVLACAIHGQCTEQVAIDRSMHACKTCRDRQPPEIPPDSTLVYMIAAGIGDAILGLTVTAGMKDVVYQVHPNVYDWCALFPSAYARLAQHHDEVTAARTVQPYDSWEREKQERSRLPRWRYYARQCGYQGQPVLPPVVLPDEAREWARQYAGAVVLVPWAHCRSRIWLLPHWLDLERQLRDRRVVILDTDAQRCKPFRSTKIIGESPARVAALLQVAGCVIGGDSGMAHLAGILGTPTVALCGPSSGEKVFAAYPSVKSLQGHLSCNGCYWRGPSHTSLCNSVCANLQTVGVDEVLACVP